MNALAIPDYISPIVGYRAWHWDSTGLKSLNGEPWHPGQPVVAACKASALGPIVGRAEAAHDAHDAPKANCTCGVYAAKSLEHLHTTSYARYGIHGEVKLWGTVVEHELGWRAQFAYPKALFLPEDTFPFFTRLRGGNGNDFTFLATATLAAIQSRLEALIAYCADIFADAPNGNIPLWTNDSGYDSAGSDYLIRMSKQYDDRNRQVERNLKKGDRVALIGAGVAAVEQIDDKEVHLVLVLTVERMEAALRNKSIRCPSHDLI